MPDIAGPIKSVLTELASDFFAAWWWVIAPIAALLIIKHCNPPKEYRVPILLLACLLGGYLVGLRKPPRVVTEVRRVEVPVERVVVKRVDVPGPTEYVDKVVEVLVKPQGPNAKCGQCGAMHRIEDEMYLKEFMCAGCYTISTGREARAEFQKQPEAPGSTGPIPRIKQRLDAPPPGVAVLIPMEKDAAQLAREEAQAVEQRRLAEIRDREYEAKKKASKAKRPGNAVDLLFGNGNRR